MDSTLPDKLIRELTDNQNRLYGYLLTLIPDRELARDILQETNLVICRKAAEFDPETSFWAWATKIAYYEVLAYYRDQGRERLVFNEALLATLHSIAQKASDGDERRAALQACLEKLPEKQRQLLVARYHLERSPDELARQWGRSTAATRMALSRIRRGLLECIQRRLPRGAAT